MLPLKCTEFCPGWNDFPAGIYLLKVNNRKTRTRCEIFSKLTIKTSERRQWHMWTYFTPGSSVFIVNFEHVIAGWVSLCQNLFASFFFGHVELGFCCSKIAQVHFWWILEFKNSKAKYLKCLRERKASLLN